LAAEGCSTRATAKMVGVQPRIVSHWRHRFADKGLAGLEDKPRPGKKPIYTKATGKRILALLDKPPPAGFARWNGPLLAEVLGDVDVQYVWRFLREHKIDLAARKSWCASNDPEFAAKAADIVGLYVDPPAKAIVLCVDEKPSIQALERAQGYLKLPNGRALTGQSHDYKRHGTTTLCFFVVGADEVIDVLLQLRDGGERCAVQRLALQDGEPCLDLIEPGCPRRRKMKLHHGVLFEPALVLMSVEVVEDDVKFAVRKGCDQPVHEAKEPFAWTKKRVRQRRFKGRLRIARPYAAIGVCLAVATCSRLAPSIEGRAGR
jgi:transposase